MTLLARRLRRRHTGHGGDKRFVIRQECKLPTFEKKTEMPDCEECREEFSIERGIFDLSWRELF
jgi:ribosomal protein L44E